MNVRKRYPYLLLFVVLALALAACARATPTPTPVPPMPASTSPAEDGPMGEQGMAATEEPHEEDVALSDEAKAGYDIYRRVGCASCHGEQGEGGIGPALAGHTPEQVRRQVRNPIGDMPAFSEEQLSDEELEKIVAFVASLGSAEAHGHDEQELTPIHVHHLMTLLALQNENLPDAIHHLEHAIELASDATQKEELTALLDMLKEGEAHDVEHGLQKILGAMEPEVGMTLIRLEAQLALELLSQDDVAGARHEVEHMAEVATGAEREAAQEVLDLLEQNDLARAQAHLKELLGDGGPHND